MKTIPHRELRNNSSKVLAEVKAGETIAVTNNGEISAILVPPGTDRYEQLVVTGRITPAKAPGRARLIKRVEPTVPTSEVIDDLKGDR